MLKKKLFCFFVIFYTITAVMVFSNGKQEEDKGFNLAVVVPNVVAGSPLYEQMVAGAEQAIKEHPGSSMKVFELGFNQAEWGEKMTSIVATGLYDAVITSNPSMPDICKSIAEQFPMQKFIFVDGYIDGHPQMASFLYNQYEQSYMLGHLSALITKGDMPGSNADLKIGMIVAQEYPVLNKMILPGFKDGAKSVDPSITVDFRIIGNWYDANKASELAGSMIDAGVDVIGVICGGAAQGVFEECGKQGKYVVFWDDVSYSKAPGVIVGSGALYQNRLVYEVITKAIENTLEYGKGQKLNVSDGYVGFVTEDPDYISTVPEEIRIKQKALFESIKSGETVLQTPEL
ncbi:MAG: BMP family ABC transporter substrate-binding protein [Spirochaetales bacterium]|nr:BMP family ABC transporter substrate-binding protein [Spirochaetales bacterium]